MKLPISEMSSSITDHHPWDSKSWKYYFMKHLLGVPWIGISAWHGFNPLGDIIDYHQDVFVVL
jgi:hypothetical protein